jgi:hypothetical protein
MKSIAIIAIALACVLGLATAQYGYYPAAQQSGGFGNGGCKLSFHTSFITISSFNIAFIDQSLYPKVKKNSVLDFVN